MWKEYDPVSTLVVNLSISLTQIKIPLYRCFIINQWNYACAGFDDLVEEMDSTEYGRKW